MTEESKLKLMLVRDDQVVSVDVTDLNTFDFMGKVVLLMKGEGYLSTSIHRALLDSAQDLEEEFEVVAEYHQELQPKPQEEPDFERTYRVKDKEEPDDD